MGPLHPHDFLLRNQNPDWAQPFRALFFPCCLARARQYQAGKQARLVPSGFQGLPTLLSSWSVSRGAGPWQSCAQGSLCLSNEGTNVDPTSVVCHTEKKSDGKSEYLLPTAPSKPAAPRFLQGLSDLKVMDGSQVTMTVQVSGLSLHLFPWGVGVDIVP